MYKYIVCQHQHKISCCVNLPVLLDLKQKFNFPYFLRKNIMLCIEYLYTIHSVYVYTLTVRAHFTSCSKGKKNNNKNEEEMNFGLENWICASTIKWHFFFELFHFHHWRCLLITPQWVPNITIWFTLQSMKTSFLNRIFNLNPKIIEFFSISNLLSLHNYLSLKVWAIAINFRDFVNELLTLNVWKTHPVC